MVEGEELYSSRVFCMGGILCIALHVINICGHAARSCRLFVRLILGTCAEHLSTRYLGYTSISLRRIKERRKTCLQEIAYCVGHRSRVKCHAAGTEAGPILDPISTMGRR